MKFAYSCVTTLLLAVACILLQSQRDKLQTNKRQIATWQKATVQWSNNAAMWRQAYYQAQTNELKRIR